MSEATILRILDGILFIWQTSLNQQAVVAKVRDKIAAGVPPDEVADMLRDGRLQSEIEAQQAIDAALKQ